MMALATISGLALACNSGPALTAEQESGRRMYEALCGRCHKLISPRTRTDLKWNLAADKYGLQLRLQANEVALLKAYLNRANDTDFQ